jgi:hypothetical protein
LRVSRRSRHSHDDYRSSRFPHHTLLRSAHAATAPPVRRSPLFARSLLGGATLEIAEPIHPASSPPRYCVGAAGGGPAVPNQPAAQARTSSTTIMASTALPQGSGPRGHRPPLRSLRRVHLGRATGEASGGCAAASATARSRSEGCGRSSRDGGPPPSVYLRPG